ncbi:DoxX family protein [Polyangium sp. 15x6]|uniref:DoxX family protein n=1 Tax=Polyangium sp. 15x6 TaxID=3042687 RepID=UPI00249B8DA6|nr:DoxX family protein [Polyangium sp. 15x6]MDI3282505.1 DoxX family protein [Polyangium sp. 15x6]
MKLRSLLYPDPSRTGSLGLLLIRLATGLLLAAHGLSKLTAGPAGLAGGLAAMGFPAPTLLAWCATLAEFLGGICVMLGLLTRPAAAVVAFNMVVAWASMHMADAAHFGSAKGGAFEYPFLLSILGLALAITGGGRYSLDAVLFGRKTDAGGGGG